MDIDTAFTCCCELIAISNVLINHLKEFFKSHNVHLLSYRTAHQLRMNNRKVMEFKELLCIKKSLNNPFTPTPINAQKVAEYVSDKIRHQHKGPNLKSKCDVCNKDLNKQPKLYNPTDWR